MLFHMIGPEMFKCRPKEITSILSEKEIHRPVASQARSARIAKKRRLRDLESDSTGAESEDDFVMSNRWGEATHMSCVWMALLSYLLFILPYSFIVFLLEARTMRTLVSLEMTWKRKTHRVIEGAWTVCLTPNIPFEGWRTGNLSGSYTRAKNNLSNNRGARLRKTVTRRQVSSDWLVSLFLILFSLLVVLLSLSLNSDRFSSVSDSDTDSKRRNLRRGQQQQVNYCETSDSSGRSSAGKRKNKPHSRPEKEHLSSDFSGGSWLLACAAFLCLSS